MPTILLTVVYIYLLLLDKVENGMQEAGVDILSKLTEMQFVLYIIFIGMLRHFLKAKVTFSQLKNFVSFIRPYKRQSVYKSIISLCALLLSDKAIQ